VTKNTRLSTPAQLHCSRSGAWEPGNEAIPSPLLPSLFTYWNRVTCLNLIGSSMVCKFWGSTNSDWDLNVHHVKNLHPREVWS